MGFVGNVGRMVEGVERILTSAETRTGDTVGDGAKPGELGLVDREMRGRGSKEALLVQNSFRGGGRERFGLNIAVECAHILSPQDALDAPTRAYSPFCDKTEQGRVPSHCYTRVSSDHPPV